MQHHCLTCVLTLPPGSQATFMDAGRAMLARALNGIPGVAPLFNYAEGAERRPATDLSPVRVRSGHRSLRMTALTREAGELLLKHLPHIHEGIAQQMGEAPIASFEMSPIEAVYSEKPHLYRATSVVVGRGLSACRRFEAMSAEQQRQKAYEVLCCGLERQAAALGVDLPDLPDSASAIEITKVVPRAPLIVKNGRVVEHGVIINMLFSWGADIKGSWSVGQLTSRGNGRIWYAQQELNHD